MSRPTHDENTEQLRLEMLRMRLDRPEEYAALIVESRARVGASIKSIRSTLLAHADSPRTPAVLRTLRETLDEIIADGTRTAVPEEILDMTREFRAEIWLKTPTN